MFRPIQSPHTAVTLVGAGEASTALLNSALRHAPCLVAADGGARLALEAGHEPHRVVGDFDSSADLEIEAARRLHRPDQNFTDFEKCLVATEAPLFLGVGFLGGRIDHQLAAFSALLKEPRPVVLLSSRELAFIAPPALSLSLPAGSPISLYPLLPATLTTEGLRYPLDAAAVAPDGLTSTSNHVERGPVRIVTDRHAVLVTLPLAALEAVLAALAG